MGRGFWILDNITALRQPEINSLNVSPVLFKPGTIIRYRYPTVRRSSNLQYPSTRVTIDYFIPKDYGGSVQLDILDENRKTITTILSDSTSLKGLAISSNDTKTTEEGETELDDQEGASEVAEVEDMQLSQIFRYTDEQLSTKPGLHRFHWDLKQRGAWDKDSKRRYKRGPMVASGDYIAILTVGVQTFEQSFSIVPDPRITDQGFTAQDMASQLIFQNKVIFLLSEAKQFEADLETQLEGLNANNNSPDADAISKVESDLEKLKNAEGAYPQQMLVSQIGYLLNMVSEADQLPGQEAEKRYLILEKELAELKR
jgi:hypothetical protein